MFRVLNKTIAMRMLEDLKQAFDEIQPDKEFNNKIYNLEYTGYRRLDTIDEYKELFK